MNDHCDLSSKAIPLAPLAQFDHAPLHRRPKNIVDAQADCQMDMLVRKECAGLRHDLRTTGARLRNAFRSGRFEHKERASLRWIVSGMREDRFSTWHSLCALTIYELARGMRCIDATGGGYGEYLNQWAENPDLPLPTAAGWTLYINDLSHLPREAVDMMETDPRRQDISEIGVTILDVKGLRYSLPTEQLREHQAAQRSPGHASGHQADPIGMAAPTGP